MLILVILCSLDPQTFAVVTGIVFLCLSVIDFYRRCVMKMYSEMIVGVECVTGTRSVGLSDKFTETSRDSD